MARVNAVDEILSQSLKKLMIRKPLSKITVTDICETAKINRRTFYGHFIDKDELLNWTYYHDRLFTPVESGDETLFGAFPELCRILYEDREYYLKAFAERGQDSFRDYCKGRFYPLIDREFKNQFPHKELESFVVDHLVEAFLDYCQTWLSSEPCMAPEDFSASCMRFLRQFSSRIAEKIDASQLAAQAPEASARTAQSAGTVTAAILTGGDSTRIGMDKTELIYKGKTFLDRLIHRIPGELVSEILVVGENGTVAETDRLHKIPDFYPGHGPISGIHAALKNARTPLVFITAVDMPFVDHDLLQELMRYLTPDADAVIPVEDDGRRQALCGLYRTTALPVVEKYIADQTYRMLPVLGELNVRYVSVRELFQGSFKMHDINTMEDYDSLIGRTSKAPVVSFVAPSGTGKTSYLAQVVRILKQRKLRVAYFKLNAEDFVMDYPGKDTHTLTQAGADVTAIATRDRMAWLEQRPVSPESLLERTEGVDLVLTEGGMDTPWPKIALYRSGAGTELAMDPKLCLAVVSDTDIDGSKHFFSLSEPEAMADFLEAYIKEG